jgi:predicted aspartyl protease
MLQSRLSRAALGLIFGSLTVSLIACSEDKQTSKTDSQPYASIDHLTTTESPRYPIRSKATIEPIAEPPATLPNAFELALDKADSGLNISQWAQSADDWRLVVTQFQDAIALMKQVQATSPNFPFAQTKIADFRHQIQYAQQQIKLSQFPQPVDQPLNIAHIPPKKPQIKISPPPYSIKPLGKHLARSVSEPTIYQPPKFPILNNEVFIAPIKRRIGGTPIIEVTFNGKQRFEMIVDTGASGTVITQQVANALGVVPVGRAKANTVSSKSVEFPVGYLDSIEVGGVIVNQIPVVIAGKDLETGLLGHDFFGNYDVTIKRNTIEFRPQSSTEINPGEIQPTQPTSSRDYHFLGLP